MRKMIVLGIVVLGVGWHGARGQSVDSLAGKAVQFPSRLIGRIQRRAASSNAQITGKTLSYLQKMEQREQKLHRRLAVIDPTGAQQLFAGSEQRYKELETKLRLDTGGLRRSFSGI